MPLPDEIMEDIFLRLDEAADLARASAGCTTFRRVATAPRFLRRFRSLHPPPVLGVLLSSHGHVSLLHAEPSHRSAPAARALARAADFTFSFVPRDPKCSLGAWCAWDALDGRVLLSMSRDSDTHTAFEDLVVCDPLHRRYAQIPPIPGDLVPSNPHHGGLEFDNFLSPYHWAPYYYGLDFEHFLAPSSAEDQEKDELSFQVICNVRSLNEVVTLVFSSVTVNWRRATSISFLPNRLIHDIRLFARHYVRSCLYWTRESVNYMLVLDQRDMKLTVVKLQLPQGIGTGLAVVDVGQDKLGMAMGSISNDNRSKLDLYCKTWRDNIDGAEDLEHRIIHLPEISYNWYMYIRGAVDGYLLLEVIRQGCQLPNHVYYILKLKTLLFERLHVSNMGNHPACFYASFPPPLSLPTI